MVDFDQHGLFHESSRYTDKLDKHYKPYQDDKIQHELRFVLVDQLAHATLVNPKISFFTSNLGSSFVE